LFAFFISELWIRVADTFATAVGRDAYTSVLRTPLTSRWPLKQRNGRLMPATCCQLLFEHFLSVLYLLNGVDSRNVWVSLEIQWLWTEIMKRIHQQSRRGMLR